MLRGTGFWAVIQPPDAGRWRPVSAGNDSDQVVMGRLRIFDELGLRTDGQMGAALMISMIESAPLRHWRAVTGNQWRRHCAIRFSYKRQC